MLYVKDRKVVVYLTWLVIEEKIVKKTASKMLYCKHKGSIKRALERALINIIEYCISQKSVTRKKKRMC